MRFLRATWLTLIVALLWIAPAWASVQVVADGTGARLVEPKSCSMQVQIAGGFARTTAQWVFTNSQPRRFEAEFIAEAPTDAVVSSFAYWFKGKKVPAYIVEKTRAARIYAGIIARRRDPALVEMIARNYFRARISPVEAGKDLRVEVTWVQPLHWKNNALIYDCPLWREGETLNLQNWNVGVQILTAPGFVKVENNFGAAIESQSANGGRPVFSLKANGQKAPPQSLQIRLPIAGAILPDFATASASGGQPYFAILSTKTPDRSSMVGAREIFTGRLNGGTGFLIVGRGVLPKGAQRFDVPAVGEKLWAARKLDDLGRYETKREEGMKLSVRYGLPSKWTSWLAIPDEERVRLRAVIEAEKREQAQLNIDQLGRQMALEVAAGGEKTRGYALMKKQFIENCRILEVPAESTLQGYFAAVLGDINVALGYRSGYYYEKDSEKNLAKARSLYLQVMRLGRQVPVANRPRWAEEAESAAAYSLGGALAAVNAQKLEKAMLAGRNDAALRTAVEAGAPANLGRATQAFGLQVAAQRLSRAWADQKARPKPNQNLVKALQAQIERLVNRQRTLAQNEDKLDLKTVLAQEEDRVFSNRIYSLREAIGKEIVAHRENGKRIEELRSELRGIRARLSAPAQFANAEKKSNALAGHIEATANALRDEQIEMQPDAEKVAALQAELERIKPFVESENFNYHANYSRRDWRSPARQKLGQRWVSAVHGDKPDPKAAEFYAAQIQKLLDEEYEADKNSHGSNTRPREKAESFLGMSEATWLSDKIFRLERMLIEQLSALRLDEAKIKELKTEIEDWKAKSLYNKNQKTFWLDENQYLILENVLEHLREQQKRLDPDAALIADLEKRVIALQPADRYFRMWMWNTARRPRDPQEYGKLRVERIALRSQREKAAAQLQKTPDDDTLRAQVVELTRRENELTVRMGDPLIAVRAPADSRQVIALLPNGEIKPLHFNTQAKQWEARFDVPNYLSEGDYTITIIVVAQSGARQHLTMRFCIDVTAPQGAGSVATDGGAWLLYLQTGKETDRVKALLPWGDRVDLKRENGVFQARVAAPQGWEQSVNKVVYFLTDLAHNQTRLEVDMVP